MSKPDFKFVVPASLEKAADGSYKVRGLASTEGIDQQGETIIQKGIDLSPIDKKKGILNWDHQKGPENTIGLLDGYTRGSEGLYIEGRLFKNHTKAKAVREIMESLNEGDRGRMGLSVEGQILERDPNNRNIIKKCKISAVALTMNPVNTTTYAALVKSFNDSEEIEFDSTEEHIEEEHQGEALFTADQVMTMIQKALGAGAAGMKAPADRSGGEALSKEDLEKKQGVPKGADPATHERCVQHLKDQGHDKSSAYAICNASGAGKGKKLKKMKKSLYKSSLEEIVGKLSILYPNVNQIDLLVAVGERLKTKYPDINESFGKGFRLKQESAKEKEHSLYEQARQRDDYEENKDKTRTQLKEIAEASGTEKKEQAKIKAQRDAAIQVGDRDHVRPGVKG